jgi:cytochrome c oxidase cbb3-type subunit 3
VDRDHRLRPLDRLHDVRRGRRAALVAGAVGVVLAAGGVIAWNLAMAASLLRTAPGDLPRHPALMAYGRAQGARVFARHCASCHANGARGDPARGVPDLTDADWLYGEGGVADIEAVVAHGVRAHAPRTLAFADMPAYAHPRPSRTEPIPPLSPADIHDMVEYVVAISGRPADPAAAARAAQVYQSRGGCYDCHGRDAGGDPAIGVPRLTDAIWLYGGERSDIAYSIAEGRAGVSPAFAGRLSPVQIREVAVFVYGLSHGARR